MNLSFPVDICESVNQIFTASVFAGRYQSNDPASVTWAQHQLDVVSVSCFITTCNSPLDFTQSDSLGTRNIKTV